MNHNSSIIITGAASGIGAHMAKAMIKRNYRVMLCDINLEAMQEQFPDYSEDQVQIRKLDVTSIENWQEVIQDTLDHFKRIDYLFNIAGIILPGFVHKAPIETLTAQIDINTKGMMFGAKLISEVMVKQRSGHIINVASLAGLVPVSGIAGYTASKFAIRGFSLAIAGDLKPHNVEVSVICPDLVNTPMLTHELDYEEEAALIFTGGSPLTVEDIAQAFLDVMDTPELEVILPTSRGVLAKVGSFFPKLNAFLSEKLKQKGRTQLQAHKK